MPNLVNAERLRFPLQGERVRVRGSSHLPAWVVQNSPLGEGQVEGDFRRLQFYSTHWTKLHRHHRLQRLL